MSPDRSTPETFHATRDGTRGRSRGRRLRSIPLPQAGRPVEAGNVDAAALARELTGELEGDVRFDPGHRAAYATDASNYRQPPIGVVLPRTKEDVERTVAACRRHGVPVLGRGGGTSLAGQCCNVAVVLDFSRYMGRVLEIDPARRIARVEPGCILDDLRAATAEHGLTFGPDPATHTHCTLGGMIGNNSCGIHSVMAARYHGPRTSDNVHRLEVLTYDGARFWTGPTPDEEYARIQAEGGRRAEIYRALRELRDAHADEIRARFPDIPRRVSGYNLDDLLPEKGFDVARALVGSESTLALVLEAELHLIPEPRARTLVLVGYEDVYQAADDVVDAMEHRPIGLEAIDDRLMEYMARKGLNEAEQRVFPEGRAFLLVEFGGESREEADHAAEGFRDAFRGRERTVSTKLFRDPADAHKVWEVRESGLGATAYVPGERATWPGWEDSAVPPAALGSYLRAFRRLLEDYGYECSFYGHFGEGLLHTRIDFQLEHRAGLERYLRFLREATDLVVRHGGSLSGEHGDGQARGALLSKMFGPRITDAFRRLKRIWDPEWRMNPGKVIDAYLPSRHLVLGPGWNPAPVDAWFGYPDDGGSFAQATLRCVGVGKCRREGGGTMCPSYMATREEQHSTRGRARILNEMMRGEAITDGWRSEQVHEALDLCLSCKGCKGDCPVNVDMATYKAEFMAHHYRGRLHPRAHYAFGGIWWWARLASRTPRLVNWLGRTQPFAAIAKAAAGVHPERTLPTVAERTFARIFFDELEGGSGGGPKVLFWPDTFKNYLHPAPAVAGVKVLQALGYRVVVPRKPLCCGRPLYDFGFLRRARKLLRRILDELHDDIVAGVPVVGVEPSCVATFRDELPELFPDDEIARRLSAQTWLLGEFLDRFAPDVELPRLGGSALLHGHCHQKAVLDFDADRRILERLGVEAHVPDSGCCGMAGPFGFEEEHYEVSQACAERVLVPAVRALDPGALVVTDGFSCRVQIEQNVAGVRPLNLSEVVWRALERNGATHDVGRPRQAYRRGVGTYREEEA